MKHLVLVALLVVLTGCSSGDGKSAVPGSCKIRPSYAHRADIDDSGRVDGVDLALVAQAYGSSAGQPRYSINVDINRDGQVDSCDVDIVEHFFGRKDPW